MGLGVFTKRTNTYNMQVDFFSTLYNPGLQNPHRLKGMTNQLSTHSTKCRGVSTVWGSNHLQRQSLHTVWLSVSDQIKDMRPGHTFGGLNERQTRRDPVSHDIFLGRAVNNEENSSFPKAITMGFPPRPEQQRHSSQVTKPFTSPSPKYHHYRIGVSSSTATENRQPLVVKVFLRSSERLETSTSTPRQLNRFNHPSK